MKTDAPTTNLLRLRLCLIGLGVVFVVAFSYIFDSKLDMNGDNCDYYMLATSISNGHGYSNIANGEYAPTNVFPPGYPFLMSFIRFFTDSFFPQKVLNGLFLLASSVLFFFFVRKHRLPDSLAFAASALVLLNYQALHFATMMMSEMSFLFFSVLTLWFLSQMEEKKSFWKDGYFYLAILSAASAYHIRTQGIALVAAVAGYFLFNNKRWKEMLSFVGGFAVCMLPWMIRNKILHLGQSRYLSAVSVANPWRPETGELGIGEIVNRFFDTFTMLITKAVPNSILPYLSVDYHAPATFGEILTAVLLFALIVVGIWRFGRFKYFFLFYILATFGVISLFSTPSENRYITPLVSYLEIGLVTGLYQALTLAARRTGKAQVVSPWLLSLLALFAFPKLEALSTKNHAPYPPAYQNFFSIAKKVQKQFPSGTMVCSRKPSLFYMFSQSHVCGYLWVGNDTLLIRDLIQSKTDYVVLEQLGYSSTVRYLYPAIQKHPELFPPVMHLPKPDTYLLKFEREKAEEKFKQAKQ